MIKFRSDTQQTTTNFLLGCITAGVGILVYLNLEKRFPALRRLEDELARGTDSLKERAKAGASHLRHTFDSGINTLKQKTTDLRERAGDLREEAEESLSEAGDRVREEAGNLKDRVENAIGNVREDIKKQADQKSNDSSATSPGSVSGEHKAGNIPPATL